MFDGKKLTQIMRSKGLTNAKLAEMVNNYGVEIKEDSFKAYRQGRANPRMEVFDAIVRVLDIPEQELFENSEEQKARIAEREIIEHGEKYAPLMPEYANNTHMVRLKVIRLDAGLGGLDSNNTVFFETITLPKQLTESMDENTVLTKIVGNSMHPSITEDDILLIDMVNGRDFSEADGIYLVRCGNKLNINTVQFLGNGQINLISANKDYPPYNPTANNIEWEIIGKLIVKTRFEMYQKLEIK